MEQKSTHSRAFFAIYLAVAISYVGVGLVAPLIALVLGEHGENSFVIGLIGTTMFTTFTLSSFPVGAATDRFGPKPVLVGGLIVYGAAIALFAQHLTTPLFFAARALEGVGAAAISVATETMIGKLSAPGERARRMSYYALSVGLGWAVGPISGTLLFTVNPGAPFVACFALSLLAALIAQAMIPEVGSTSHHVEALARVFSKAMLVPASAGALYGYLMSSLVTLVPRYLTQDLHARSQQMGIIITAVIAGVLVSQVPMGRAADRFGKRRMLLVCAVVLAITFALMAMISDWRWFIPTGIVAGAMAGGLYPLGLAIIGTLVAPKRLGAANSLFSLSFGIGSLTGPGLSGLAMTHFGDRWLFYLPLILTTLFTLELLALYRATTPRQIA
ncbi:MAG TPA: MFS transporter [Blastocatellia bacterium]|nr:MFS transporter [Blastocatellia bacterium]